MLLRPLKADSCCRKSQASSACVETRFIPEATFAIGGAILQYDSNLTPIQLEYDRIRPEMRNTGLKIVSIATCKPWIKLAWATMPETSLPVNSQTHPAEPKTGNLQVISGQQQWKKCACTINVLKEFFWKLLSFLRQSMIYVSVIKWVAHYKLRHIIIMGHSPVHTPCFESAFLEKACMTESFAVQYAHSFHDP